MSSIPQNHFDENDLIDCVQRFFSKHHVGKLLAKCNGMKEKGVSPVSLLRYKLSNIFIGRSMYMQQRTGSFKEAFSKNTFYRFLNSAKTNWLRFTSLLAADIARFTEHLSTWRRNGRPVIHWWTVMETLVLWMETARQQCVTPRRA